MFQKEARLRRAAKAGAAPKALSRHSPCLYLAFFHGLESFWVSPFVFRRCRPWRRFPARPLAGAPNYVKYLTTALASHSPGASPGSLQYQLRPGLRPGLLLFSASPQTLPAPKARAGRAGLDPGQLRLGLIRPGLWPGLLFFLPSPAGLLIRRQAANVLRSSTSNPAQDFPKSAARRPTPLDPPLQPPLKTFPNPPPGGQCP